MNDNPEPALAFVSAVLFVFAAACISVALAICALVWWVM